MPQINLGTVANDGTGSALRAGGQIIDQYGLIGDKTLNAAFYKTGSITSEAALNLAIPAAAALGTGAAVWVPQFMLPYTASLVSFNPAVKMLREGGDPYYWEVLAYGASWNNLAVDTVAFQKAVDGAGNLGGIVLLPAGTGLLDTIYLPSNVQILGQGMGTSVCKMAPTSTGDAMFLNKTYVVFPGTEHSWTPRETNIVMRDFTIDGNKANVGGTRYGIHFRPSSYITLERLRVVNTALQGIKTTACVHVVIQHCQSSSTTSNCFHLVHTTDFVVDHCIVEPAGSGDTGIEVSSGETGADVPPVLYAGEGVISNNVCDGAASAGILIRGLVDGALNPNNYPVQRMTIVGNTCVLNSIGIQLLERLFDITVVGNTCSSNTTGLSIQPTGFPTPNRIMVGCNVITGNTGNGIFAAAFYESSIVDNLITRNGGHGVTISPYQVSITGNTIRNNNTALAATTYNLDVFATAQDVEIRDNVLTDVGGRTTTADVRMATGQTRVRWVGNAVATATGPCGDLPITLTDAATVVVDAGVANPMVCVLTATAGVGATRAIGGPTNSQPGQRLTVTFIQDATGGRALTWNAVFKVVWSDAGNTANKRSSISFISDGVNFNQDGAQTPYV